MCEKTREQVFLITYRSFALQYSTSSSSASAPSSISSSSPIWFLPPLSGTGWFRGRPGFAFTMPPLASFLAASYCCPNS